MDKLTLRKQEEYTQQYGNQNYYCLFFTTEVQKKYKKNKTKKKLFF